VEGGGGRASTAILDEKLRTQGHTQTLRLPQPPGRADPGKSLRRKKTILIPKIIHYVWLGPKPLDALGQACLASWRRHLPGWEIRRWDESNSPVGHPFVQNMIKRGRFAFASDYVRLHALVGQGGLYMDTDCELLRDPSPLFHAKFLHLGFHSLQNRVAKSSIGTHWIASAPDNRHLRALQGQYEGLEIAVMNNTLFTRTLLPFFEDQRISGDKSFAYLEAEGIRLYHPDLINPTRDGKPRPAAQSVVLHHAVANWGGPADPLPWWRKLYDLRLDRKLLRPVEAVVRKIRNPSRRAP
jgi:Glycosyltransferase sugar-binding region containing DXD motif